MNRWCPKNYTRNCLSMDPLPLPRHGQHGKLISPAAPSGWSLRLPHVKFERLERHGARRRVETWHFTYFTVRVFLIIPNGGIHGYTDGIHNYSGDGWWVYLMDATGTTGNGIGYLKTLCTWIPGGSYFRFLANQTNLSQRLTVRYQPKVFWRFRSSVLGLVMVATSTKFIASVLAWLCDSPLSKNLCATSACQIF